MEEKDMTAPSRRTAALWSTVAVWVRNRAPLALASKNYGHAKRLAWEVFVAAGATTITTLLTELLHGR